MRPRRRSFFVSSAKLPSHILTIWMAQVVQDHQGVQPELPAAARYCPLQRHAAARNLCPRTAPRQRRPGSPLPAAPGRGPSPAHTAPVRARPYPVLGNPRRVRAPGPAVAALAPACRARQYPPRAAAVTARSPSVALKLVQTGAPSGFAASTAGGSRHRHPEAHGRCPAHPWQATGQPGASAPPTYPPCECRLPAGLTVCDGIGIGAPGAFRVPHHPSKHGANIAVKRSRPLWLGTWAVGGKGTGAGRDDMG
jgi:hypothetical protein